MKPEGSAGCHQTLSSWVGSGHETTGEVTRNGRWGDMKGSEAVWAFCFTSIESQDVCKLYVMCTQVYTVGIPATGYVKHV